MARSDLQPARLRLHLTPLDGLLLLVVLIRGSNLSIVKVAIEEIPIFGFDTLRMATACIVLLTASRLKGEGAPDRGDRPRSMTLGFSPLRLSACATLVGTLCYTPFGVPDLLPLDSPGSGMR